MDWLFPYPSRRMPVFARNAVATSQPLAAQAGLWMLQRGGNAVDAALAAAITLTVVEPTSNGIGSDAFAMVWDGRDLFGLNGSGRSPRLWSPARYAGRTKMAQLGWDAVTVPGAVDLWSTLSNAFGCLPFGDLFEPAIRYAAEGYVVAPVTAAKWADAPSLYREYPSFGEVFLPGGRAPLPGELFRCPDLKRTLEELAATHGESLYRGKLARRLVAFSDQTGGCLTDPDLSDHATLWVEPLCQSCLGVDLFELPPNSQGLTVLVALGILKRLAIERYPVDSWESTHLQIETMKRAFDLCRRQIADPGWMRIAPRDLLDEELLDECAAAIRLDRAAPAAAALPHDGGTVYLTAADRHGTMVSYIQSNYKGFGSGIVIPGTGIALQNRGAGFTLEEGHPNRVDGGKRPYHTIIPGFVMKEGAPLMSFGVMGAHMQAQGHLQMMVRIFAGNQNPQAAADAPRWYIGEDGRLFLERGFPSGVAERLAAIGHLLAGEAPASLVGGTQIILRLEDGYCAASDPRKDGQAVGY